MGRWLYPAGIDGQTSIGLLFLRVVMGAAFILHGWPKIQVPFGWMEQPDVPSGIPGVLQFLAALSEFGGGIALILGLFTRLAAIGLGATMGVAAGMYHIAVGDPFVAIGRGQVSWELAAVYLVCSVLFLLAGPGQYSADAQLFGRSSATTS